MKNKLLIIAFFMFCTFLANAHEGDEEVTVKFAPRFGGRVAAVVEEEGHKDMSKHDKHDEHDEARFMSEILVSDENRVRLYFYDLEMKDVDLKDFPDQIFVLIRSVDGSSLNSRMKLLKVGRNYIGKLPFMKKKPYDFYVDLKNKEKDLHITFKNMD